MATSQPPVGIDHPTVVPTNYDPDGDDEDGEARPWAEGDSEQ